MADLLLQEAPFWGGIDGQGLGLLAKFDVQGKIEWHQTFNNPPWSGGYQQRALRSVAQTGDEGYVALGSVSLVKADQSANLVWAENDYDSGLGDISSLTATTDGGFAVAGNLNNDVWLAKFPAQSVSPSSTSPIESVSPSGSISPSVSVSPAESVSPSGSSSPTNESSSTLTLLIVAVIALLIVVAVETILLLRKKKSEN
jgi:hypothetical protein